MARLLSWPIGLGKIAYQRLTGPRATGAASSESLAGFVQTVSSVFGSWRYQISLQAMKGRKLRLYRGLETALHGGTNAVRVPFNDPDIMSFAEAGITAVAEGETNPEASWSNGKPWSNDENWQVSRPCVSISVAAAEADTTITLADEYWGHGLLGGEWIGFFPFHFGKYEITQVIDDGNYRIWPPLRKSLTTESYATLNPVMAMRLESEAGGTVQRGLVASEGNTLTLTEVQDSDVRDYFGD